MLSLFLPRICIHCTKPAAVEIGAVEKDDLGKYLCPTCLNFVLKSVGPSMETMLNRMAETGTEASFQFATSAATFIKDMPVQSVLHTFKYGEMPRLGKIIGRHIGEAAPTIASDFDLLVAVPLHRTRLAERGFNQAEMVAKGIAEVTKVAIARPHLVRRTRPTPTQTALSLHERLENVRGAFGLGRNAARQIEGKRLLLIDDVMTTGATLSSLAETLLPTKPAALGFAVFAAVEY